MNARERAVQWALGELGAPVLMGYRGDLHFDRETRSLLPHGRPERIYDCSGLVTCAIKAAGGADMRGTHNAQMLFAQSRALTVAETPLPGDLCFYGVGPEKIVHVAMWCSGGKVLSADGATWGIVDFEQAKVARCRVRLHETMHFRPDQAYSEVRRNVWLDALDKVSR